MILVIYLAREQHFNRTGIIKVPTCVESYELQLRTAVTEVTKNPKLPHSLIVYRPTHSQIVAVSNCGLTIRY